MALLGFKSELINKRRVTNDQIDEFTSNNNVKYFEISTFENKNIEQSFNYLITNCIQIYLKNGRKKFNSFKLDRTFS